MAKRQRITYTPGQTPGTGGGADSKQPVPSTFTVAGHGPELAHPTQVNVNRGYGVDTPGGDPANNQANGRMVNPFGERIDFYIEEIEAKFEMMGSTAQSRTLRQFFPHNIVQPSITVRGRAPNHFQYNRLAAFVRVSHLAALRAQSALDRGESVRSYRSQVGNVAIPTTRLVIFNGSQAWQTIKGRSVKGPHKPWMVEGYIKMMPAGGKRFNHAPAFEFEFLVAESLKNASVGIWKDDVVRGSQLRPWLDIFRSRGRAGFINDNGPQHQTIDLNPFNPGGEITVDEDYDGLVDLF